MKKQKDNVISRYLLHKNNYLIFKQYYYILIKMIEKQLVLVDIEFLLYARHFVKSFKYHFYYPNKCL